MLLIPLEAQSTGSKPKLAGQSDNPQVLIERGKRFEHGVGEAQDVDRAIQLYCDAARLGDAEAHYRLGWIYLTGRAGKVDELLAATWLKKASAKKNPWASAQLNKLKADGVELLPETECVLSAAMVARTIPRSRARKPVKKNGKSEAPMPEVIVRSLRRKDIETLVRRLAPEYDLDPEMVLAVVEVESNFNPRAESPKNAQGLMQLIPATASRFGVRNVWDPLQNLRGGMSYLRWLLDHFDGDLELALAGYNAGENAVAKYRGIPPYPETQAYVKRIVRKLPAKSTDQPTAALQSGPRILSVEPKKGKVRSPQSAQLLDKQS